MTDRITTNVSSSRRMWVASVLAGLLLLAVIAGWAVIQLKNRTAQGCVPTLALGPNQYEIRTIQAEPDEVLKVPSNKSEVAFWVDGTTTNQVFALSPTADNLALQTALKSGDIASVTWANCNSRTYLLGDPQIGVPDEAALMDQSISQLTVFIQPGQGVAGFVLRGELEEEMIQAFNTLDPSQVQAEISLEDVSSSADGSSLTVSVSILNTGAAAFTLSASDISLSAEGTAPLRVERSDPALPIDIQPGATETIQVMFSRPSSPTSTLNILGVEYEIEGY